MAFAGGTEEAAKKELKKEKGLLSPFVKKEMSTESVERPLIGNEVKAAMVRDLFYTFLLFPHGCILCYHFWNQIDIR